MKYISTRNSQIQKTASQAILQGLSADHGLFVPDTLENMTIDLNECLHLSYKELAHLILSKYLNDFSDEQISNCLNKAYDSSFDTDEITPLVKVNEDYILELFHGPTSAFKDVALQLLPHLLTTSFQIQKSEDEIVILTATSGDTGKAALEGFKNVENVKIIVFYPKDGVSEVQKAQMLTTEGNNVYVIGVNGNFDDCQTKVKECFADEELKALMKQHHQQFSSANSINIGRLIPQIVYYFKAYCDLINKNEIKMNEKVNIAVPTGNFGNILAAFLAKQMGLPVEKLICASNENNVLTDFIQYGVYNSNRTFKRTNSPSMDIVISSNLERLLYFYCQDDERVINLMDALKEKGSYELMDLMKKKLQKDFYAAFATQKETKQIIKEVYEKENYLLDPHSAVAYKAMMDFKSEHINEYKTILSATASPYKFMDTVLNSIHHSESDEFEMMKECEKMTHVPIPQNLKNLKEKEVLHHTNIEIEDMKKAICDILGYSHD